MDILESNMPKKAYLAELKGCLMSPFGLFSERMTGIIVGSFFSVAYYCPWEWNRRINNECNRAWGWVKETENGTEIRFVRGKGLFSPFWLIAMTVLFVTMAFFVELYMFGHPSLLFEEIGIVWVVAAGGSLVTCGLTALESCITKRGVEGAGEITRMLRDPSEYYC